MDVKAGCFYFVSDSFFKTVNDPFLKQNYENTKRPHFAIKEKGTSLIWLVPCSSKVEKFEEIIKKRQNKKQRDPYNTIKIVSILNRKSALLFQDMFPIAPHYIQAQYIRGGQPVRIADTKLLSELESTASNSISLIRRGVKFTPTQPDANRIEKLMQDEMLKLEIKKQIDEKLNPKKPNKGLTR